MRFLFPFFLAGVAAIAVPIVLHLARRRTRKEVRFSTLMFLAPTLPRFRSRRRVEHLALLALRCLAVVLLAAGFARPFLRKSLPPVISGTGERAVILLDTSASMRRGGLWAEAVGRARALLGRAGAVDRVSVIAFDRRPQTVMSFEDWAALTPAARSDEASRRIAALAPSFAATDLGRALVAAAEAIGDDQEAGAAVARVVVVSDFQQGSRLEALAGSEWPAGVELRLEKVAAAAADNAALQALPDPHLGAGGKDKEQLRVRVTNTEGTAERFRVRWQEGGRVTEVAVPPGSSRVAEVPGRGEARGTLILEGDAQDFDNKLHVAPPFAAHVRILYMGPDDRNVDDAQRPLFYLQRAFPTTRLRAPDLVVQKPDGAGDTAAQLAVVAAPMGPGALAALREHLGRGRTVLVAMDSEAMAPTVAGLVGGANAAASEARGEGYALLTEVDLAHPVLSPFADPRFGDFTKIRFWKHRRLDERRLPGARVLARFDDGAPAWLAVPAGKGIVFVMTSGWHPADSQLALSSKFVPLLHGILEASAGLDSGQAQFFVGDAVGLPPAAQPRQVRKPDGAVVTLGADAASFSDTDQPGFYELTGQGTSRVFAVNIDPAESATAPMPPETLERVGLTPGRSPAAAAPALAARERAFQVSLERDQRLWRFLIAAVLAALAIETWMAARLSRRAA